MEKVMVGFRSKSKSGFHLESGLSAVKLLCI